MQIDNTKDCDNVLTNSTSDNSAVKIPYKPTSHRFSWLPEFTYVALTTMLATTIPLCVALSIFLTPWSALSIGFGLGISIGAAVGWAATL